MIRDRRQPTALAALAMVLVLSGCTGGTESGDPDRSPAPTPAPDHAATSPAPLPESVLCDGRGILDVWIPVERLLEQTPATELGPRAAAAVQRKDLGPHARGVAFDALPSDWFVAEESPERVVLLQPYVLPEGVPPGSPGTVGLPDFSMRLFLIDPPMPEDLDQWYPVFENECTFRVPLEGLSSPDLAVDDHAREDPHATHVDLVVHERECVGGRSAKGRVEVVALREGAERIEVLLGIRPPGERFATCQGNPPTPFRLELGAPVGDRQIVDIGRIPARPLPITDTDRR